MSFQMQLWISWTILSSQKGTCKYYRYHLVMKKVFNYSELQFFEGTSYKIHTFVLGPLQSLPLLCTGWNWILDFFCVLSKLSNRPAEFQGSPFGSLGKVVCAWFWMHTLKFRPWMDSILTSAYLFHLWAHLAVHTLLCLQ